MYGALKSFPVHWPRWLRLVFVLGCWWFLQPASWASSVPLPLCVYYGQALDGYGWPYRGDAEVILFHGTNEVVRHAITGSLKPGVNFSLPVHLHTGLTTNPYVPYALKAGDSVSIRVQDSYGQKTIMENAAIPAVGNPGDIIRICVTAADDEDGDGLSDAYEQEMLAYSGSTNTIWDLQPEDDFDGDGVSNQDEYRAGTFAFLDYDYFYAGQFQLSSNQRLLIRFISVPGKAYSLQGTSNLCSGAWSPCPYALSESGALDIGPAEGSGGWMSLYVPVSDSNLLLRLEVE